MSTNGERVKAARPAARRNEIRRADALDLRLRDVAAILNHASTPDSVRTEAEVRRVVTLLMAELAILRHPDDPEQAYWARFCGLLAELFPDDPDLWDKHALAPIAAFQAKMASARQTFERDHETKHHHHRLVEDAHISTAFELTRTRVGEVFGEAGCSIRNLVRERKRGLDPADAAFIRIMADAECISRARVKQALLAGGRPAVQAVIEAARAKLAKLTGKRKPGPKPSGPQTVAEMRAGVAKRRNCSETTVARAYASVHLDNPGIGAADAMRLAEDRLRKRRGKYGRNRAGQDAVVEHYTYLNGQPPSASQIAKWRKNGTYVPRMIKAENWRATREIAALPAAPRAKSVDVVPAVFVGKRAGDSTRSVWPPQDRETARDAAEADAPASAVRS